MSSDPSWPDINQSSVPDRTDHSSQQSNFMFEICDIYLNLVSSVCVGVSVSIIYLQSLVVKDSAMYASVNVNALNSYCT